MKVNKTFLPDQKYENRTWFILDCQDQTIGRIAPLIISLLKGKTKPQYSPSIDIGDYVILINAQSILTNKANKYYIVNKPGRPGKALKIRTGVNLFPKLIIERAVKKMLSIAETKRLMRRLRIYNTTDHPHRSQKPVQINLLNYLNRV